MTELKYVDAKITPSYAFFVVVFEGELGYLKSKQDIQYVECQMPKKDLFGNKSVLII